MLNLAPPSAVNLFVYQQKIYRMDYEGMSAKNVVKIVFIQKIISSTNLKQTKIITNN